MFLKITYKQPGALYQIFESPQSCLQGSISVNQKTIFSQLAFCLHFLNRGMTEVLRGGGCSYDDKKKSHAPENCLPSPSKNNFPSLKQGLVIIDDLDLSQSDSKQRFLFRLTPYFRGNHHLEEVMYYENLRRSQLLTLIEKFRDVLFSCQHEDPVTLYFYNR